MPYEILLQHVSIIPCLYVFGISHFGLYYLYSSTNNTKYYRQDGENTELVYDQNKHKWYQDSFSSSFEVPDVMKEKKEFTFKVIIIVFAVCVGSVLLCYFLRRKYISPKDKDTLYEKND